MFSQANRQCTKQMLKRAAHQVACTTATSLGPETSQLPQPKRRAAHYAAQGPLRDDARGMGARALVWLRECGRGCLYDCNVASAVRPT